MSLDKVNYKNRPKTIDGATRATAHIVNPLIDEVNRLTPLVDGFVDGGSEFDTIDELTAGAGVTVDGVLLKDGGIVLADGAAIDADIINEATAAAGVTADGVLLKDGGIVLADGAAIDADIINEATAAAGVTADGVLLKDGGAVFADGATIEIDIINEATNATGVTIDGVLIKDLIVQTPHTVSATSSNIALSSGDASVTGDSGDSTIKTGRAATGDSGDLFVKTGDVTALGNAGDINVVAGSSTVEGDGGNIVITAGTAATGTAAPQLGGNVTITSGAGAAAGTSGKITLNMVNAGGASVNSNITYHANTTVSISDGAFVLNTIEAKKTFTGGATENIAIQIPSGAKVVACQLIVDTLIVMTTGVSWSAAYNTGSTQAITAAQALTKNTKTSTFFNANGASDIMSAATDITITPNAGTIDSGSITALVWYYTLTDLTNIA